ncbi:MAG: superfamily I DNA and RNA helicase and helicaseubunit [Thermofilum sp.]|jgi:hypothetical protein|nr:superfamily I DNA and RNA helicase and helicaseubunit [Thermofilum sp.]
MQKPVYIPEKILQEMDKRGLSITDLILSSLKIDPSVALEARVEMAEKYFQEAEEYVSKNDPVQASEKLYKAVEDCIKTLAQFFDTPEYQTAIKEGGWWTQLLGKAARRLSRILNEPRLEYTWAIAYDIHVWGLPRGEVQHRRH